MANSCDLVYKYGNIFRKPIFDKCCREFQYQLIFNFERTRDNCAIVGRALLLLSTAIARLFAATPQPFNAFRCPYWFISRSIMRRLLIGRRSRCVLGLGQCVFHELHLTRQSIDGIPLARHHFREILDCSGLVRDLNFQVNDTFFKFLTHFVTPLSLGLREDIKSRSNAIQYLIYKLKRKYHTNDAVD